MHIYILITNFFFIVFVFYFFSYQGPADGDCALKYIINEVTKRSRPPSSAITVIPMSCLDLKNSPFKKEVDTLANAEINKKIVVTS